MRVIEVNLPIHVIRVYDNYPKVLVKTLYHFSIGRPGYLTKIGMHHEVLWTDKDHFSKSFNAAMPYSVFFYGGQAFHAGNVHTESHGCIHLSLNDAKWLFNWVGSNTKVDKRIRVRIIGPYSHQMGLRPTLPTQGIA